jgi:hypothetical protein
MNCNALAKRIANHIHLRRFEVHRGVTPVLASGVSVAFGNDDYAGDPRTRELVRLIFDAAYEAGVEVLGFATNDGRFDTGCSWAIVLNTEDMDWIKARLHDAFFESHSLYVTKSAVTGAAEPEPHADDPRAHWQEKQP